MSGVSAAYSNSLEVLPRFLTIFSIVSKAPSNMMVLWQWYTSGLRAGQSRTHLYGESCFSVSKFPSSFWHRNEWHTVLLLTPDGFLSNSPRLSCASSQFSHFYLQWSFLTGTPKSGVIWIIGLKCTSQNKPWSKYCASSPRHLSFLPFRLSHMCHSMWVSVSLLQSL